MVQVNRFVLRYLLQMGVGGASLVVLAYVVFGGRWSLTTAFLVYVPIFILVITLPLIQLLRGERSRARSERGLR